MSHQLLALGEIHSGREDTVSVKGTYILSSSSATFDRYWSGIEWGLNTFSMGFKPRQNSLPASSAMTVSSGNFRRIQAPGSRRRKGFLQSGPPGQLGR